MDHWTRSRRWPRSEGHNFAGDFERREERDGARQAGHKLQMDVLRQQTARRDHAGEYARRAEIFRALLIGMSVVLIQAGPSNWLPGADLVALPLVDPEGNAVATARTVRRP